MAEVIAAVTDAARDVWGPVEELQRVTDPVTALIDGSRPGLRADLQQEDRGPLRAPTTVRTPTPESVPVIFGRPEPGERPLDRRLRRSGVDPAAGLALGERKPPWLRVNARMGDDYLGLQHDLRDLGLVTVCEEAGCPNIYECWSDGTATFMINGSRCTRACGFCQVDTRHPLPLDPGEPERVAEAVARMGLATQ